MIEEIGHRGEPDTAPGHVFALATHCCSCDGGIITCHIYIYMIYIYDIYIYNIFQLAHGKLTVGP